MTRNWCNGLLIWRTETWLLQIKKEGFKLFTGKYLMIWTLHSRLEVDSSLSLVLEGVKSTQFRSFWLGPKILENIDNNSPFMRDNQDGGHPIGLTQWSKWAPIPLFLGLQPRPLSCSRIWLSCIYHFNTQVSNHVKALLLQCATPMAVCRLNDSKLKEEAESLYVQYFEEQQHRSLTAYLRQHLGAPGADGHQQEILYQV